MTVTSRGEFSTRCDLPMPPLHTADETGGRFLRRPPVRVVIVGRYTRQGQPLLSWLVCKSAAFVDLDVRSWSQPHWRNGPQTTIFNNGGSCCGPRRRQHFLATLIHSKGAVPDQARGPGHTAPTWLPRSRGFKRPSRFLRRRQPLPSFLGANARDAVARCLSAKLSSSDLTGVSRTAGRDLSAGGARATAAARARRGQAVSP